MFIICTFCSSCYTRYKSSMRYFCANISNFKLLKLLPTPIWLAPLLTLALSMLCWLIMSQLKGSPLDRSRYSAGILLASQCSIFLAVALRQLDIAKIGCDPKSWLQGHAIWHLLPGLSGFLTWRFATFRPPQ